MSYRSVGSAPIVAMIAASALWASGTILSKDLLSSVPPIGFLVIQLAPSVVVLWLIAIATRVQFPSWQILAPIASLGLLNPGLSYTLSIIGLVHTPASVTTVLWAAEPGMIALLARLVLGELLTLPIALAIGLGGFGVLLVSGIFMPEQETGFSEVSIWGTSLILGGVAACAFYTVLCRKLASSADPLFTVTLQQTVGLISILGLLAVSGEVDVLSDLSRSQWLGGSVSGLMYYVAAFWLYVFALRHIAASLAGAFLNLIPVFGIAMAYSLLGERLAPMQWIGAALVVSAMAAMFLWPDRAALRPAEPPIDPSRS
jgi:drug/metabolite transporter (DMT)-like permease